MKVIKTSIPWLAILTISLMVVFGLGIVIREVWADTVAPQVEVGNVAPTVGAIIINGGSNITVVENATTAIYGTTTITDTNGWDDITSATATLFQNGSASTCNSTAAAAATGPNWCYYDASCSLLDSTTSNSRVASCTAYMWFNSEPTTGTSSIDGDWEMDIQAYDGTAYGTATSGGNSVEMNTLYALDITSSIDYGTVSPGGTSSDQSVNATNTGNQQIDVNVSGEDMDDGSSHTIPIGQQKYSSSSLGDWVGEIASSTAQSYNLDLARPTATTSDSTDILYWQIKIPAVQYSATYTGTNTLDVIDAI